MDEIIVILNPAAHSEKASKALDTIQRLPGSKLWTTASAGDALVLARRAVAEGFRTVVAAGGDGTINDVVNGLVGSDVALGVLPVGTMNVFAAELGLPSNLKKAWRVIQQGHTRQIDLIRANDHYCVQLAGVGFDAQIVEATSPQSKKSFGPLSYVISGAQIAASKPPELRIEANDRQYDGSFVLVGNGRYYGGPLAFFKDAKIDDGKLDVLIFKNLGYLDIVRYLGTIIMGRHTRLKDVEYFQTTSVTVTSDQAVPVEVDGELIDRVPVTFRISSRKLKVLTPAPV